MYQGQGFADRRKKKIVHEYKKILRKEGRKLEEWSEKMHKIYTDDDKTATPSVKKLVKSVSYNHLSLHFPLALLQHEVHPI